MGYPFARSRLTCLFISGMESIITRNSPSLLFMILAEYRSNEKVVVEETKEMLENRNVNIITDADCKKLALINDIRFKGKRQIDWDDVTQYLEGYVGDYYEIEENAADPDRI